MRLEKYTHTAKFLDNEQFSLLKYISEILLNLYCAVMLSSVLRFKA